MNHKHSTTWKAAQTSPHLLLRILFSDAQHYGITYGICMPSGFGKTFSAHQYCNNNKDTHYILCDGSLSPVHLLLSIYCGTRLTSYYKSTTKAKALKMISTPQWNVGSDEQHVLIIDSAHLLKPKSFIALMQAVAILHGKCGLIVMGDASLRTAIIEGMRNKLSGFEDAYKTMGRRFITVNHLSSGDIEAVCRANGMYRDLEIEEIKSRQDNTLHGIEDSVNTYCNPEAPNCIREVVTTPAGRPLLITNTQYGNTDKND